MNTQTFIFVHSQDIILDFINNNKFSEIPNLKYIFLGNNPIDKLTNIDNIIIARELPHNIEEYPRLTSYTGWYAIWKNNLCDSKYLNLFEYDINMTNSFYEFNELDTKPKISGYISISISNPNLFKTPMWSDTLITSIGKQYNKDLIGFVDALPNDLICSVTSNHTFEHETFNQYMTWMEPLIEDIKHSPLSGHQVERSIIAFYLLNEIPFEVKNNMITHFQLDSHKTQGIFEMKKHEYNKLLK